MDQPPFATTGHLKPETGTVDLPRPVAGLTWLDPSLRSSDILSFLVCEQEWLIWEILTPWVGFDGPGTVDTGVQNVLRDLLQPLTPGGPPPLPAHLTPGHQRDACGARSPDRSPEAGAPPRSLRALTAPLLVHFTSVVFEDFLRVIIQSVSILFLYFQSKFKQTKKLCQLLVDALISLLKSD